jgi:hypothetical protein
METRIQIKVKSWNLSYIPGKVYAPVAMSTTHITEAGPRSSATKSWVFSQECTEYFRIFKMRHPRCSVTQINTSSQIHNIHFYVPR